MFILLCCSISYSVPGQSKSDTIRWRPDYKLKWEDFMERPDTVQRFDALTSSYTVYHSFYKDKTFTSIGFNVYCFFDKKHSWVNKKKADDDLLKHEQGHFHIAALFAMKLYTRLNGYKPNKETIKKDLEDIYNHTMAEKKKLQNRYDYETNHARNKVKQQEWNEKIAAMVSDMLLANNPCPIAH